MKTYKQGISLIVLVITIIVMAILAAAIIISVSNANIITKTQDSIERNNASTDRELIVFAITDWKVENSKTAVDIVDYLSSNELFDKVTYFDNSEILIRFSATKNAYLVNIATGEITKHGGLSLFLDSDIIVVGLDDVNKITAKYDHEEGDIEWLNSNEEVIEITTNENIVTFETVGYGNAIITAKVGEHTATCEVIVPEINNAGIITRISAGTKNQLLKINKLNESGLIGMQNDYLQVIDITDDIDMDNAEWRPLYAMYVTINGNGNKISNLNCIQETANGRSGLMGYAGGSKISNLTLENVTAIGTQAGAFMGFAIDGASITDCKLIGNNIISWQQNTGTYKESYSGIGALIGMPCASSSKPSSATIEGNVTIKYNNMATECFEVDETGALGFKVSSTASLDFNNIDITNATITKEGIWTEN